MEEGQLVLGRYELKSLIARGGTARVYLAYDRRLGRQVAVKVLFEELSGDSAFVERFRREAQAAANLNHPNIVSVYDWGEANDSYFLVMEYVNGVSLSRYLADKGRLGVTEAASIGAKVANALYYAHRHGVIHRDIKPGNVLLTEEGGVKVTDFGIARAGSAQDSITQTGVVMGTAQYFSPEQAQGMPTDGRSDIYSLGVVLYEMAAGRPPFTGDSPVSVALKHVREPVPPLRELVPDVPEAFEAIVMKALAKNPEQRYASAAELARDLEDFVAGKRVSVAPPVEAPPPATEAAPAVPEPPRRARVRDPFMRAARLRRRLYLAATLAMLLIAAGLVFLGGWNLGWFGAPASIRLPDVTGQPVSTATQVLTNNGLKAKVVRVPSAVATDLVISERPRAGTVVKEGSVILLEVSSGPLTVKVPPVVGLTLADALSDLKAAHLKANPEGVYSTQPANTVLSQDPAAGTLVQAGSVVTITYSSPNAAIAVPPVVGLPLAQAVNTLTQSGLQVGNISYEPSPSVPNGDVVSASPAPGTVVNPGTKVDLVVSTGPGQNVLPRVIGYTQDAAVKLLTSPPYNLVVAIQNVYSCPADVGIVVGQNPAGGSLVSQGSEVTLQVGAQAPFSTTSSSSTSTTSSSTTSSSVSSTPTTVCP
jgi:beta-lactam-binding protein with PASTA domain/tRNA A-37 threonylcarbamoyl transferase component Bud32